MKVAVIEDEKKLALSLADGLRDEGYEVDVFFDGEEGELALLRSPEEYDLTLLDLMLPQKSGLEICSSVRKKGYISPILVLTARDTVEDKVEALDSGADDFVTKPFSFEELLARSRALLRRPLLVKSDNVYIKDLSIDPMSREVYRSGELKNLTAREFDMLWYFIQHMGEAVSREELFVALWNRKDPAFSNVVDVHIRNLRSKIDDDHDHKIIQTVRGVGYKI